MTQREGQIKQRGPTTWLVSVYLGSEVIDGKRKKFYRSETVYGSEKAAQKKLRGMLAEKDTGRAVKPSRELLKTYLGRWLQDVVEPNKRKSTYQSYKQVLDAYILPDLGTVRLDKLTPATLQRVIAELTRRGLSPRTIRYAMALLNSALKTACRWRILAWNPLTEVDLPKNTRREWVVPDENVRARLLKELERDTWWPLWCLMVSTGLRPGEALGLQWADLDLDAATLTVQRSLSRSSGGWELTEPKTSNARRKIGMPPGMVEILRSHRAHQAEQRMEVADIYNDRGLVFADALGNPLDWHNVRARHFRKACSSAALTCGVCEKLLEMGEDGRVLHGKDAPEGHAPDAALELLSFRPYDLRHLHASLVLQHGVDLKSVSARLGHANAGFTLSTYAHTVRGTEDAAAKAIGAELFGESDSSDKQSDKQDPPARNRRVAK